MEQVFLVDGSSIFFRAYHAIKELRRSDGMATNAIYGYVSTIRNILKEYKPKEMIVAFDLPEPTFRKQMYDEYKANRVEPPDDLIAQIPYIKKVTETMGIPQIELPGYEADDLIGTLTDYFSKQKKNVMIVSLDKDLLQLVGDSVHVLRLSPVQKSKIYDKNEIQARYGAPPDQLLDIFALMGDASDNIPGVPGIGEKTAIALIQEFKTLENLYEHIDQVSGNKRRENLIAHKDKAYLSRELVTIKKDVPVALNESIARIQAVDETALRALFEELEFRSFAAELAQAKSVIDRSSKQYKTVQTINELNEMVEAVERAGICAIDTETTSLNTLQARMVGMSISIADHQGWYLPFRHSNGVNLSFKETAEQVKRIVEAEDIHKIGHHLKYDSHVLANDGVHLSGPIDDTLVMASLVYPQRSSQKLDHLAKELIGMEMTPITDLIGEGRGQKSMSEVDIATVTNYACEDTDATWRLRNILFPKIEEYDMIELYRDIEVPLILVLLEMERKGVCVDSSILKSQSVELENEIQGLEEEIYRSVGKEFNINSPSQLAEILYDDLKLLQGRKRSTRADILEKLANEGVPIATQIIEYRHRQKIKSTYLDALQKMINPVTGRVHTTYNQSVVNTGRISSNDPNLQNIPIRTDLGRRVRRAFVAEKGCVLISLDYSQIELRVLAHISQDPGLRTAFNQGKDIHAHTASEIFGVEIHQVTSEMRRKAKEINFGLNYGMSPYGLARRLGISDEEAAAYIETYFARYPNVQAYMDRTVSFAHEHLYVTTVKNRRIPTLGIRDGNRMRQENAKRAAINAPIQGSAADLLKKAMVDTHRALKQRRYDASIILTVHDELVIEARKEQADEVCDCCKERMEQAIPLSVPTPVETAIGTNWAELN